MATPGIEAVLSEANRLVGLGLHQAASDILDEFLSQDADNKYALRSLARIRLLQGRPHDAVPLLLRALRRRPKNQDGTAPTTTPPPASEVASQAIDSGVTYADHDFARQTAHDLEVRRKEQGYTDTLAEDFATAVFTSTLPEFSEASRPAARRGELPFDQTSVALAVEADASTDEDADSDTDALQEEFEALPEISAALESVTTEAEADVDFLEVPSTLGQLHDDSVLQHSTGFDWESLEPEGADYDEAPTRSELELVERQGLTRTERARQVALAVGIAHRWDEKGVALLTAIFERYWWNAAKRSIERELTLGLTRMELKLAWEIREIWEEHPEFAGNFAYNGYLNTSLSWPAALEVVRGFRSMPDAVEVEQLLLLLYQRWYDTPDLLDRFAGFVQYVRYRCRTIPGKTHMDPWMSFEALDGTANEWSDEDAIDALTEGDWNELERLGVRFEHTSLWRPGIWRQVEDYQEVKDQLNPGAATLRRRRRANQGEPKNFVNGEDV